MEAAVSRQASEEIVSKAEVWHYWRRELRTEKEKNQGVVVTVRLFSLFFKRWGWKMPLFCLIRYFRFGVGLGWTGSVLSLEEKIFVLLRIWGWLVGLDVGQGFSLIWSCIRLELKKNCWNNFGGAGYQFLERPNQFYIYSKGNLKNFGRAMAPPRSQVAPPLPITITDYTTPCTSLLSTMMPLRSSSLY